MVGGLSLSTQAGSRKAEMSFVGSAGQASPILTQRVGGVETQLSGVRQRRASSTRGRSCSTPVGSDEAAVVTLEYVCRTSCMHISLVYMVSSISVSNKKNSLFYYNQSIIK